MISNITGVVLAGGRGQRMNGQDKGLLSLCGRPLVAHALDALRPQVAQLLISANRNLETYSKLGVPVLTDSLPGFQGPLAGMLTAMRAAKTDWVLFVACDTPQLPGDLAARLYAAVGDRSAAYATTRGESHHTCCLLRRGLADAIEGALNSGRRAVRDFHAAQNAVTVDFPGWPGHNLNTPEDLHVAAA